MATKLLRDEVIYLFTQVAQADWSRETVERMLVNADRNGVDGVSEPFVHKALNGYRVTRDKEGKINYFRDSALERMMAADI